ncbi:MAG: cation transporter [Bauldia litoralis]
MSASCDHEPAFDGASDAYRRVLWTVIAINATMFGVEVVAGALSGSRALFADSLDFLGDSATYALSLWVIGRSLATRARAALFKGASLGLLGLWVLGSTVWGVFADGVPHAATMSAVGVAALVANVVSAYLLFRFRDGDANVRSVWLCSRNDAIGNVAVVFAAGGVWVTSTGWPDLAVAGLMASLFLWSSVGILAQARAELRQARAAGAQTADDPATDPGAHPAS